MAKLYFGCDGRSFRFKRGANKFGLSWDRQKMEERERARERARAAKGQQAHDNKAAAAASGSETLPPQGEGSRGGAVSAAQKEVK